MNREQVAGESFFYLNTAGQTAGPHSLAELHALSKKEVITGATLISADGWPDWKTWEQIQAEQPVGALPGSAASSGSLENAAKVAGPAAPAASGSGSKSAPQTSVQSGFPPAEAKPRPVESPTHCPWETSPDLAAKVEAHNASGNYRAFPCKCNEFLNRLMKNETFKALKNVEAEIRVYPDLVGVDFREEKPGCLMNLVLSLPEPLRPVPAFFAGLLTACLQMPSLLAGLFGLLVMGAVGIVLLVALWYVIVPVLILMAVVLAIHQWYLARNLPHMAVRVAQDPKSPYAVKQLFKRAPRVPRYWQRAARIGEVVQILRLETRRKLLRRSMVIVVQDNPIDNKPGCLTVGDVIMLSRLLKAERRIFAFSLDGGEPAADEAAQAMSNAFGLPVIRADFKFNRFILS